MEWTKIPTDVLLSRIPDKEILAIVKYQLVWASLEREPTKEICLRYMTSKQLQQALNYSTAIERRVNADIKSVESHRNSQKLFYQKNQSLKEKSDNQSDGKTDSQRDGHTDGADKIRLDKIRLEEKERGKEKELTLEQRKAIGDKIGMLIKKIPTSNFDYKEGV